MKEGNRAGNVSSVQVVRALRTAPEAGGDVLHWEGFRFRADRCATPPKALAAEIAAVDKDIDPRVEQNPMWREHEQRWPMRARGTKKDGTHVTERRVPSADAEKQPQGEPHPLP
jgi:hypothetical protein